MHRHSVTKKSDCVAALGLPERKLVLTGFEEAIVLLKRLKSIFRSPDETHVKLGTNETAQIPEIP